MEPDIVFSELTPYLKDALKYIGTAAVGGFIGNRADQWFMSLFYHQRKRLIKWLDDWNPSIEDIKDLLEDENLRLLFSKAIADISNEMNESKLLLWPDITDSIVRKKEIPFDQKEYFISLFNRLDTFSIKYLATLYTQNNVPYDNVFNLTGEQPQLGSAKHIFFLGQLQCATSGLTDFTKTHPMSFFLTNLGKEFIDFIADKSKDKLSSIASR